MCLLTDADLSDIICATERWVDRNQIHIYPFEERSLTPVGYDLRVGRRYASKLRGKVYDGLKDNSHIKIRAGDTVLIETLEDLGMPETRWISGLIMSKVSMVSKGLSHVSTTVDPDWKGRLLIAITNHSKSNIKLKVGDSFCTVVFLENKSPSDKDCGKDPRRADILVKDFAAKGGRFKDHLKYVIQIVIVAILAIIGYVVFGNSEGFVAMGGVGVGIAYIIHRWFG